MLQNMAQNLQRLDYSSLGPIVTALRNINLLMARAQGIAFQVDSTEREFARLYPKHYAATVTTDELARDARGRWVHSMDALRQTMLVQAQVVQNVEVDRSAAHTFELLYLMPPSNAAFRLQNTKQILIYQ